MYAMYKSFDRCIQHMSFDTCIQCIRVLIDEYSILVSIQLDVVVHTRNPSTWEAETGELQVHGQPQQLSEALCNIVRPCFKNNEE